MPGVARTAGAAAVPEASPASRRGAAITWAFTAALTLTATLLGAGLEGVFDIVLYDLMAMALATIGYLIVSREPKHRIGLLFCGLGIVFASVEVAQSYGLRAADAGWPAGEVGDSVNSWAWLLMLALWGVVFVLFPDGRLPGRRWRFVPWLAAAGCALAVPGFAMSASMDGEFAGGENPLAVDSPAVDLLIAAGMVLYIVAMVGAVVSLILRFRRSRGVERQQLKWFVWAAAPLAVSIPLWPPAEVLGLAIIPGFLSLFSLFALPIAAGIAILRYRLYDIDVVINRTLVYGGLTATLAGTYLAGVLLLQLAVDPLTDSNSLAIAISTLAVAALFRPARHRIQAIVDRRFYRRRYDAARTLERFGAELRDEVDLDALGGDLRRVVQETMQPVHVSLWLRAPKLETLRNVSRTPAA